MSDIVKMTCGIEKIIYYNEGWGILLVSPENIKIGKLKLDSYGYVTLKGIMPALHAGDVISVSAECVEDPKYGTQYQIVALCLAFDFKHTNKKDKKKFLLSLFTPGQVENMYEALEDPFNVLEEENIVELCKVKGCGTKTAPSWINRFKENYNLIKIFTALDKYNLTNNMIEKLLETYKSPELVIEKVTKNPYILCTEVKGVGWAKADKIALDGGLDKYDNKRICAYILYYLECCGQEGMSWITTDELLGAILQQLGEDIPDENISKAVQTLKDKLWWNDEKDKIGLKKYYFLELDIAKELLRIQNAKSYIKYENWEEKIKTLEEKQGWQYTNEQKQGIKTALDNNVTIIQGLAGTGKSTLVSALLAILYNYTFVQTSLSGRAASRMFEITGKEGFTIHRLLSYPKGEPKNGYFVYCKDLPLPYDIYILDEISMVGAKLFYHLLQAIPDGAKLICLGDSGQLESIGSGNVAYDMDASPEIPSVRLTQIHRQAQKSAIITESIKIRHGEQIVPKDWAGEETRGELQDLSLNCFSDISNTYYKVLQTFSSLMSKDDFNIMETQVLSPVKQKGAACTYQLNNSIQDLYNPEEKGKDEVIIKSNGNPYALRVGDKVINVKNNYNVDPVIYNGNIGIIKKFESVMIDDKWEDRMVVDFYGIGTVSIPKKYWNNIELGYAITVHKYQGSQADNVIFALDYSSLILLSRELVYTAITRAKKKTYIIAQTSALRYATHQESVSKKQTHLQYCLYEVAHPKLVF